VDIAYRERAVTFPPAKGDNDAMTQPDDLPVEVDDEEAGLDATQVNAATADANEADLIEQATTIPVPDDDFDR
jgi:hypothetical protein